MWNERVAPVVSAGFLKAPRNKSSSSDDVSNDDEPAQEERRKLARTALYVLMQRTIVPQCPLVGYGEKMDTVHHINPIFFCVKPLWQKIV